MDFIRLNSIYKIYVEYVAQPATIWIRCSMIMAVHMILLPKLTNIYQLLYVNQLQTSIMVNLKYKIYKFVWF